MKVSQNDVENIQSGPKLRNINEQPQQDIIEEKPAGADFRLKIAVIAIAVLTVFVGVKGSITKASLSSKLEEQQKLLAAAQAESLLYGITEDEDGDMVIPETEIGSISISELDWDSLDERNMELLTGKKTGGGVVERTGFVQLLLNWKGKSGYEKVRQTLIDEWDFAEDSKLLTSFMPPMEDDLDANMSLSGNPAVFELSNDGKTKSYFLICTVRNTINGKSATGSVGIRVTINEDGTLSNVMAQTLS